MTAQVAIVCDRCGDVGTVGSTPQEARDALPHWIRRRGQDLCPVCRAIDEAMRRNGHHQRPNEHDDDTLAIEPGAAGHHQAPNTAYGPGR